MIKHLLAFGFLFFTWQGFYLGAEQTNNWHHLLKPGFSTTTMAMVGVGKVSVRAAYIQPIQKHAGPVIQIGGSVRVF